MSFTESIKSCYSNYFNFSGRASRSEYWWFYLFNFLIGVVYSILLGCMAGGAIVVAMVQGDMSTVFYSSIPLVILNVIFILYSFGTLIPSLALSIRRLHDTGRSGWNILFFFIPLVGIFILLAFFCGKSDDENKYGLPDY